VSDDAGGLDQAVPEARGIEFSLVEILGDLVRATERRRAAALELEARRLIPHTLRPRLRWAAYRPRALRLLRRLGWWRPPVIVEPHGDPPRLVWPYDPPPPGTYDQQAPPRRERYT